MYKLHLSKKADKQLKEIAKNTSKEAVLSALKEIREDPYLHKPLTQELSGKFTYKFSLLRLYHRGLPRNRD
jgi:mRNA-degrading endonuclease RelE of RelBE toxin-antitoxin system